MGQLLQFDCAVDGLNVPALQETQAPLLVDPVAELYLPVDQRRPSVTTVTKKTCSAVDYLSCSWYSWFVQY